MSRKLEGPKIVTAATSGQRPATLRRVTGEEAAVAPALEIVVEREGGKEISRRKVVDTDVVRIGSHEANELVLADPHVSRFHCRLEQRRGTWCVTDSDSLNGTRVEEVRVRDAMLPVPEARLFFGDSMVRVRALDGGGVARLATDVNFGTLQGRSRAMRRLFTSIERIAPSEATVLIEGESGTGKELVATEIAQRSPRADKPFIIIDCGAIAPTLVESTLFGHARGAFTGADKDTLGAFEAASGGTVFLDEVGEMPLDMQPKLLRVLEAREVRRVGETRSRPIDVRVIAATNRRLEVEVNHGRFREDLFYRLSVVTLRVPPLRERIEDLEILVAATLESLGSEGEAKLFTRRVLFEMAAYHWPGNVRELRNAVERAVVMNSTQTPVWEAESPSPKSGKERSKVSVDVDVNVPLKSAKERLVAEFEKRYVTQLLEQTGGNVSLAARKAGMDRINMHRVILKHGIKAPRSLRD